MYTPFTVASPNLDVQGSTVNDDRVARFVKRFAGLAARPLW